jgi:predicted RNA-binding protein
MVSGYLRKSDPARSVVLRQIRDVISGTAVSAPMTMKQPRLSEAMRENMDELISKSRQTRKLVSSVSRPMLVGSNYVSD